jgi:hypothetical protein
MIERRVIEPEQGLLSFLLWKQDQPVTGANAIREGARNISRRRTPVWKTEEQQWRWNEEEDEEDEGLDDAYRIWF